jgi:hypothetical protein
MYILVIGTPISGFNFEGLFSTEAEAAEYGEQIYPGTEWWVSSIAIKHKPVPRIRGAGESTSIETNNKINNKCVCGHYWADHHQNVHRAWVCSKCQCRKSEQEYNTARYETQGFGHDKAVNPDGTNYNP